MIFQNESVQLAGVSLYLVLLSKMQNIFMVCFLQWSASTGLKAS